jgi:gliding motility-associated protein GldM
MINLMYLVFIGMLALNVSTEVLDGFELVEESLLRSVKSSTQRNDRIFADLKDYLAANPEKTQEWYDKGKQVKERTDSLFNYTQDLKTRIVIKADGKDGDPENLKHPDDLNAAFEIMFEHGKNDGAKLKSEIDNYRDYITLLVNNPSIKNIIETNLSTEPSIKAKENKQNWEESMFDKMPVAAAITLLTKLQNDIRYAEGEVLSDLVKNIDVQDYRVNKMEAFIIPESQIVMQGTPFRADIGFLAQDSTQKPIIYIGDKKLPDEANGKYIANNSAGSYTVKGHVEIPRGDGESYSRDFSTQYYVVKPSASVAPVLMNVLYAGIDNDISISAGGVPSQNVTATMTNGSLTLKGNDTWVAKPSKVGTDAVITVTAKMSDGRSLVMANTPFRVRQLPDPTAYLTITDANGNKNKFNGGRGLSKAALLNVDVLEAAIDDGIIFRPFSVLKFEISTTNNMGITISALSDGARFSNSQKEMIRGLDRGKRAYIRGVITRGPDGIERPPLSAVLEIIIN